MGIKNHTCIVGGGGSLLYRKKNSVGIKNRTRIVGGGTLCYTTRKTVWVLKIVPASWESPLLHHNKNSAGIKNHTRIVGEPSATPQQKQRGY